MGNIYEVKCISVSAVEAENEEEARTKFLCKDVIVNMIDIESIKVELKRSQPIPFWSGCVEGLQPVQTEQEAKNDNL